MQFSGRIISEKIKSVYINVEYIKYYMYTRIYIIRTLRIQQKKKKYNYANIKHRTIYITVEFIILRGVFFYFLL